ncbi:hypothetical protein BGX38DRAFT_1280116 [Terfezia claveryi]|nr:hypothetical protein BGX38DRAFT_1280116 [Terfezia claveryi]
MTDQGAIGNLFRKYVANANVVAIANRLISKSFDLESRYREALDNLEGRQKWELATEVSRLVQGQMEKIAYAADVQKRIIDEWGDEDFEEMEADRGNLELDLAYTTILVPLSEVHEKSEKRKANAVGRLVEAWSDNWEEDSNIEAAKVLMKQRIQERLAAKRTKKVPYLMSRDVADRILTEKGEFVGGRLRMQPLREVMTESGLIYTDHIVRERCSLSKSPAPGSSSNLLPQHFLKIFYPRLLVQISCPRLLIQISCLMVILKISYPIHFLKIFYSRLLVQISIPHTSSKSPTPILRRKVHKTKKQFSGGGSFPVDIRKRKRQINKELQVNKKLYQGRKFQIHIPVINLDIDKAVEEMKRGLVEDEDKDDVIAVEQRRLQRLMDIINTEIREVEDSDMGDFEDENMVQDEEDFEDM